LFSHLIEIFSIFILSLKYTSLKQEHAVALHVDTVM